MTNRDVGSTSALSVGDHQEGGLQGTMDQAARRTGETAQQLGEKVRETGEQQANQQKQRAAEGIETIAEALRDASQRAGQQQQPAVEQITRVSADQAERLSHYLREANVSEMIRQAEGFARRQPAVFLAGAFAIGLLGSRLMKAGMSDGQGQGGSHSDRSGYGRYSYRESYAAGSGTAGATSDQWPEPVSQVPGYDPTIQRRERGI